MHTGIDGWLLNIFCFAWGRIYWKGIVFDVHNCDMYTLYKSHCEQELLIKKPAFSFSSFTSYAMRELIISLIFQKDSTTTLLKNCILRKKVKDSIVYWKIFMVIKDSTCTSI